MESSKVVLITGGSKRIGQVIVEHLHALGYRVVIHYATSKIAAHQLMDSLNQKRDDSARCIQGDFNAPLNYLNFIEEICSYWGRLDAVINNASSFFPTKMGAATFKDWDSLFNTNVKAAFFLSQAAKGELLRTKGAIVNIIDVYGFKPLKGYAIYSAAKASLVMMTRALSLELAPDIRVNAIAPGSTLWPEGMNALTDAQKEKILRKIPLKRLGSPADIAAAVSFMLDAPYITGQILAVDGGKLVT